MVVLVTCKNEENPINNEGVRVVTTFFPLLPFRSCPLRECLRTHKVFTKDQCFYLNYHKFSIKSYVVDVY